MTTLTTRPLDAPPRDGRWRGGPGLGVYVHVPFCLHRCHYCDFNTYEGQQDLFEPYVDALVEEVQRWPLTAAATARRVERDAQSVFFGGGTPTLLDPDLLARVLGVIRDVVGICPGAEVTVEANPETVDESYLEDLLEAGFNRLSIGVQSLRPGVLAGLGRTHDAATALNAVRAARSAGFDDVNADLIYGSVWESEADWIGTLEELIEVGPDHVSAYALTVEEGTPLDTLVRTGRIADVDGDVQAERYEIAQRSLTAAGYERYEISNWARPGRGSVHNVCYWSAGNYLGFGAGAHAHVDGRRWFSTRLPRDFVSAVGSGSSTEAGHESLPAEQRAGEALMLGLRLIDGIDVGPFADRFGQRCLADRAGIIADLTDAGMLEADDGRLRLTPRATLVANDVICRLL